MSATLRPIGEIIDSLGVKALLDDTDMIVEVLVIAKVVEMNGGSRPFLGTWCSEGADWISQRGLLAAALETQGSYKPIPVEGDPDEEG